MVPKRFEELLVWSHRKGLFYVHFYLLSSPSQQQSFHQISAFICVFGQKVWAEQTEAGYSQAAGQEGMNFGPSNRKDSLEGPHPPKHRRILTDPTTCFLLRVFKLTVSQCWSLDLQRCPAGKTPAKKSTARITPNCRSLVCCLKWTTVEERTT